MKIFLECLPCMLRQALEAAYLTTDDENLHEIIMIEAMDELAKYQEYVCAPQLAEVIHNIVKKHSGKKDPYATIKSNDIRMAQNVESKMRRYIVENDDILKNILRVAAIGNILDSALYSDIDLNSCLSNEMLTPFVIRDRDAFSNDLSNARQILIIGDNAGEAVFDRLLIEYLSNRYEVIYAVRGAPIINDITIQEALKLNIADYAKIISTGCGMPGAFLDACNEEFRYIFDRADVVISKGQGNFEALSGRTDKSIYYLLKAKCKRIAERFDVELNNYVFSKN